MHGGGHSGMRQGRGALLISYNGVLEPIVQSQVLPYLRGLSRLGYQFVLLSFEKWDRPRREMHRHIAAMKAALSSEGIRWLPLRYHKRPSVPATLWDIFCGMWAALWLVCRHRIEIVHARASIAGVMAIIPVKVTRCRFIFDIRGFNAEEYVDGSGWSRRSLRYRVLKRLERTLMLLATENIVLTEAARAHVQEERYVPGTAQVRVTVIPTCVDLDRFTPQIATPTTRPAKLRTGSLTGVYLGSLGTWYLVEEMVQFLVHLHRDLPALQLLCLTQSDPAILQGVWTRAGLPVQALTALAVPHEEVPAHLRLGRFGLCFIKPSLSKQSSYPTKIGEYLACGLPVVINAPLGDCDRLIRQHGVGVVIQQLDPSGYVHACEQLLKMLEDPDGTAKRCRQVAEEYLSLSIGTRRYREVYERCLTGGLSTNVCDRGVEASLASS